MTVGPPKSTSTHIHTLTSCVTHLQFQDFWVAEARIEIKPRRTTCQVIICPEPHSEVQTHSSCPSEAAPVLTTYILSHLKQRKYLKIIALGTASHLKIKHGNWTVYTQRHFMRSLGIWRLWDPWSRVPRSNFPWVSSKELCNIQGNAILQIPKEGSSENKAI